jgi:DNA-directed RNA polymerase specialized sigma24 family protein|tara:strand:- start:149 stop:703 length:555 start_codon:yes stop_codon:yes gene_type:complete
VSPDECVEEFAAFAYSLIGQWHKWSTVQDMEQAAIVGLLEACSRADWDAISAGDGRADHDPAKLFMSFAHHYIVNELKAQALLRFPVSGAGSKWHMADVLPVSVSLDAGVELASPDLSGQDQDVVSDMWAAASGLDVRSESIVLGSYMLGHSDAYMADFFGVSTQRVGQLRAAALVKMRETYTD